jgi:thiamine kinase-like enzyme
MDGRWMKLDASSHGDDHFYPGPCDIAWDVAGAIVEWDLNSGEIELLARDYSRLSGDQISKRLHAYQISYCAFRLGFTLSAALSAEASEQPRFRREAEFYRDRLSRVLHLSTSA